MERRLINVPQERPMTVPDEIDQLLCSCDRLPLCLAHIPEELRVVIPRESSRRLLILVVRHGFRETAGLLLSLLLLPVCKDFLLQSRDTALSGDMIFQPAVFLLALFFSLLLNLLSAGIPAMRIARQKIVISLKDGE